MKFAYSIYARIFVFILLLGVVIYSVFIIDEATAPYPDRGTIAVYLVFTTPLLLMIFGIIIFLPKQVFGTLLISDMGIVLMCFRKCIFHATWDQLQYIGIGLRVPKVHAPEFKIMFFSTEPIIIKKGYKILNPLVRQGKVIYFPITRKFEQEVRKHVDANRITDFGTI